jgi:hypothetical protein
MWLSASSEGDIEKYQINDILGRTSPPSGEVSGPTLAAGLEEEQLRDSPAAADDVRFAHTRQSMKDEAN